MEETWSLSGRSKQQFIKDVTGVLKKEKERSSSLKRESEMPVQVSSLKTGKLSELLTTIPFRNLARKRKSLLVVKDEISS